METEKRNGERRHIALGSETYKIRICFIDTDDSLDTFVTSGDTGQGKSWRTPLFH